MMQEGTTEVAPEEAAQEVVLEEATLLVDTTRCTGCGACVLACSQWQRWSPPERFAHQRTDLGGGVMNRLFQREAVFERGVVVLYAMQACLHCYEAPCLAVCPVPGAIERDPVFGEAVILNDTECIGCQYCAHACPFGVLTPAAKGVRQSKCNLCWERLGKGWLPACVAACPTGALVLAERPLIFNKATRTGEAVFRCDRAKNAGKASRVYGEDNLLGGFGLLYVLESDDPRDYFQSLHPSFPRSTWWWRSFLRPASFVLLGLVFIAMLLHRMTIGPLGVRVVEEEEEEEISDKEYARMIKAKRLEGKRLAADYDKRTARRLKKRKPGGRRRRRR